MTTIVIIIALIVLLAYDLYAFLKGGFQNTISYVIYTNSLKYPIIPFLAGLLAGHFFWSQRCG